MQKPTNNNIFFQLNQPKLFNFLQYEISDNDPVRKLSSILEGLDFSSLMQVFSYKTKVHPIRMFSIIVYAYSRNLTSTRDIEMACHENIKFRFLLQDSKIPDHSTISRFLVKTEDILPDLFEQFVEKIFEMENISTETIYIDGTKIEAYANKYTFVWKKSIEKYRTRLDEKILELISNFNDDFNLQSENKLFRKDGLELEFLYSNKNNTVQYFWNPETNKKIKYNARFRILSNKSKENVSSNYGKQLRMNRSIQVEGAFAVLKEDMKLRKLKVRSKKSVLREICLFCIAYNFNRYLSRNINNRLGTTLHSLKVA
ncbi:putative transposase [Fusobacterium varium]|nr:putative transposase [Fusobacterium varium]